MHAGAKCLFQFFLIITITLVRAPESKAERPEPEDPDPPAARQPLEQKVIVEEERIFSPAPRTNGAPPAECDTIRFLRYRPATVDGSPREVRAILLLIPGLDAGASCFDHLGRNLVSLAESTEKGSIEVWALDRRPNCIEDLTGMNAAEEARDPEIAVNYYFFKTPVNGRIFPGFLAGDDLPFLSEFGLQLLMKDIYTVLQAKIPDRADRQKTVFIGGHSFGGFFSTLFAGWDFDGDAATADDAGYNNCAGIVVFDARRAQDRSAFIADEGTYRRSLEGLRSCVEQRCRSLIGLTPEALALLEIIAMYADWAPDEESTLLQRVGYSRRCEKLFCLFHSKNLINFMTDNPCIRDFRYTNEALLGVLADDNFQPLSFMKASLGFLHGGAVVPKTFPCRFYSDHINEKCRLFIAGDSGPHTDPGKGPLYSWVNFDAINSAYRDSSGTIIYTTPISEVSDIRDFARMIHAEPLNFLEWYYTGRITLDAAAVREPFSAKYGLYFLHEERSAALPSIEFLASNIPGYNHLDLLCAAVDRPERRKNEVLEPLLDFILKHSRGSVVPVQGAFH